MNKAEEALIFFDDYFKSYKVECAVFASSLLHIIRDKQLPGGEEVDFCVRGDDLNDDLIDHWIADRHFKKMWNCREKYGEMYFTRGAELLCSETGVIAFNPVWKKMGKIYQNPEGDSLLLWENHSVYDNWKTFKYLGREFKCPSPAEDYLKMWYGDDWRIPKKCGWQDNKNLRSYNEIIIKL